jgi:hypothetical protein
MLSGRRAAAALWWCFDAPRDTLQWPTPGEHPWTRPSPSPDKWVLLPMRRSGVASNHRARLSFLYVWSPGRPVTPEDRSRFAAMLEGESRSYAAALGHVFHCQLIELGELLIGQVRWDLGVWGFRSRLGDADCGIAWSGVCEAPLQPRTSR